MSAESAPVYGTSETPRLPRSVCKSRPLRHSWTEVSCCVSGRERRPMRYLAIVGVGLGITTLGACGGSDDALGTRGNSTGNGTGGFLGTVSCAADVDCR